jgi:hypothetical protein
MGGKGARAAVAGVLGRSTNAAAARASGPCEFGMGAEGGGPRAAAVAAAQAIIALDQPMYARVFGSARSTPSRSRFCWPDRKSP